MMIHVTDARYSCKVQAGNYTKMKRHVKIAVLLSSVMALVYLNQQLGEHLSFVDNDLYVDKVANQSKKELNNPTSKRNQKKILVYTPLFGSIPWWQAPYDYKFTDDDGRPCPVPECEVTYNKSHLSSSDLVVFHGCDLPSIEHMKLMSKNKQRPYQNWLFLMHESPVNSPFHKKSMNGMFNLTATYRSDSDILVAYWYYHPLKVGDPRPNVKQNFAEGKTKLITWLNSHCDSDRIGFIANLRKFISVDVYGGCSKHFKPQTPDCPRNKKCKEIQSQYKFFLAMENSFCIDYITEKYWLNSLDAGLVPVVLGYGDYKNKKLAIPGSYIDARDFSSMEDLANYLLFLDKNDDVYNRYHQWRFKYKLAGHNFFCLFCEAIHNYNIPSKTVQMDRFWGEETCDLTKEPLRRLIATAQVAVN